MDQINSNFVDNGFLRVDVVSKARQFPIADARVSISYTGAPDSTLEQLNTNQSGQTDTLELDTPPLEYSMEPSDNQPFSEYTITVNADGYEPASISGCDLFSGETAIQTVELIPAADENDSQNIVIPANTLWGNFPPKIPEAEIKPVNIPGEIVLSRVVIPEYVVVHDGSPNDSTARDYYVRYRDYIKNVASSEIYSTWPDATIRANILAIMSFTLNRVYTEWYRNQSFNFTITSSTAYDHKWVPGRNIFENISYVVDEMFDNYLSRPNVKQPILTQYCDGKRVSCPQWLSQWGSKSLGDQGYSAAQIIRYYYGDDMYINSAEEISGIPSSWPGYDLTIGSSGQKVRQLQEQLNRIRENYNAIPYLTPDGIYGERTAEAIRQFQRIFDLPQTGITDYPTWYKVSDMYVRLSRIAELR